MQATETGWGGTQMLVSINHLLVSILFHQCVSATCLAEVNCLSQFIRATVRELRLLGFPTNFPA